MPKSTGFLGESARECNGSEGGARGRSHERSSLKTKELRSTVAMYATELMPSTLRALAGICATGWHIGGCAGGPLRGSRAAAPLKRLRHEQRHPARNSVRTLAVGVERRIANCPVNRERSGPTVVFRIVHVAGADRQAPTAYRDQAVEVALGPSPTFPAGNSATLTRRVPANRVVTGAPPRRGKPRPLKEPRPPRVAELLRKAQAWRAILESGEVANQAEIARREGVTRARVTQVIGLLRLAPEIHESVFSMPKTIRRPRLTELALRSVARLQTRSTTRRV